MSDAIAQAEAWAQKNPKKRSVILWFQNRAKFNQVKRDLEARGLFKLPDPEVTLSSCTWCFGLRESDEFGAKLRHICYDCYFDQLTPDEREICENEDREAGAWD